MLSREITDPSGTRWKVGRKILPWSVRRREFKGLRKKQMENGTYADGADISVLLEADSPWVIAAGIGGVILLLAAPVFVLAIELVLAIVVGLAVVISGFVLRRPWLIYARRLNTKKNSDKTDPENSWGEPATSSQSSKTLVFGVKGWKASQKALDNLTHGVKTGIPEEKLAELM